MNNKKSLLIGLGVIVTVGAVILGLNNGNLFQGSLTGITRTVAPAPTQTITTASRAVQITAPVSTSQYDGLAVKLDLTQTVFDLVARVKILETQNIVLQNKMGAMETSYQSVTKQQSDHSAQIGTFNEKIEFFVVRIGLYEIKVDKLMGGMIEVEKLLDHVTSLRLVVNCLVYLADGNGGKCIDVYAANVGNKF